MAMYEVPSGPRRLPVERLPIDVPSATLTPELDVVVDGEVVGSVEDAELAQLASSGVTPVVAVDGGVFTGKTWPAARAVGAAASRRALRG